MISKFQNKLDSLKSKSNHVFLRVSKFYKKKSPLKIIDMFKKFILLSLLTISSFSTFAQYQFTETSKVNCTAIKNQENTGTCWSFSTVSFLESELLRTGQGEHDLSEMYIVRNIYQDKARNYVLRQGKANFSQGSLAHDVIRAYKMGGIVPESVFDGKLSDTDSHDHSELEIALKSILDGIVKQKRPSPRWAGSIDAIMDNYMGDAPEKFVYQEKEYTPASFAKSLKINPEEYLSFTSYMHHPYFKACILEIPDNYSNGSYINLQMGDVERIVDNALANGFTVSWDGDVSEKGFSSRNGIAVLPVDENRKDLFTTPGAEIKVTQELRQATFMDYSTTDDHLMHIVGTATDQNGTKYYIIKNSWGEVSEYKGYLYMSAPYFRLKTVGVLVHKDAVPKLMWEKLGLNRLP